MSNRASAVALLITSMFVSACEPDECSANFTLSGAINYQYVWRYPSTECTVRTLPNSILGEGTGIKFDGSFGSELEIETEDLLTVGIHDVDLTYRTSDGSSWSTINNSMQCVLTITRSEVVDWVQEDHRRLAGSVECGAAYLSSDHLDDEDLTITGLVFTVYTADNGYF